MADSRKLEIEVYQPEGKNFYRIIVTDVTEQKALAFQSTEGDLSDTNERRKVLDGMFGTIPPPVAQIIRQRLFPSDTRIFEKVDGRYVNARYPE